jgi:hypothetical protein
MGTYPPFQPSLASAQYEYRAEGGRHQSTYRGLEPPYGSSRG